MRRSLPPRSSSATPRRACRCRAGFARNTLLPPLGAVFGAKGAKRLILFLLYLCKRSGQLLRPKRQTRCGELGPVVLQQARLQTSVQEE
jgi:hypothetical protein